MATTEKSNLLNEALTNVFLRNEFYRKKYQITLAIYIVCLIIIVFLIGIIVYLVKNPTRPLYFATDDVTRLIQDIPLSSPNMSTQNVAAWVLEAVQAANSYDFANYRQELQDAQKYFTEYGWRNYMQSLQTSNNLLALTQRKLVVSAQIVAAPQLVKEGLLGARYAWKFEMPMLVTYWSPPYDDKSKYQNALRVSVTVRRENILESYKGLGIVQMIETIVVAPQTQTLNPTPG